MNRKTTPNFNDRIFFLCASILKPMKFARNHYDDDRDLTNICERFKFSISASLWLHRWNAHNSMVMQTIFFYVELVYFVSFGSLYYSFGRFEQNHILSRCNKSFEKIYPGQNQNTMFQFVRFLCCFLSLFKECFADRSKLLSSYIFTNKFGNGKMYENQTFWQTFFSPFYYWNNLFYSEESISTKLIII